MSTPPNVMLKVLTAVVELADADDGRVSLAWLINHLDLPGKTVETALRALAQHEPRYFDYDDTPWDGGTPYIHLVFNVTEVARRAVDARNCGHEDAA